MTRHGARSVLTQSTAAGLAVFSDLDAQRRTGISRLLDHLTDDELAAFLKGLRAMSAARAAVAAEAPPAKRGEARP